MILKLFALRDQKTDAFMSPVAFQSAGQAIRFLKDNTEDIVAKHPEDFELFELADYDPATGVIVAHSPRSVLVLSDLREQR